MVRTPKPTCETVRPVLPRGVFFIMTVLYPPVSVKNNLTIFPLRNPHCFYLYKKRKICYDHNDNHVYKDVNHENFKPLVNREKIMPGLRSPEVTQNQHRYGITKGKSDISSCIEYT